MGFIKEFKDFVMRGNVVDLAVGVIIGGAFMKQNQLKISSFMKFMEDFKLLKQSN